MTFYSNGSTGMVKRGTRWLAAIHINFRYTTFQFFLNSLHGWVKISTEDVLKYVLFYPESKL